MGRTEHEALVAEVRAAADEGPGALRLRWAELVADVGPTDASRIWQRAFAAIDAEQQT